MSISAGSLSEQLSNRFPSKSKGMMNHLRETLVRAGKLPRGKRGMGAPAQTPHAGALLMLGGALGATGRTVVQLIDDYGALPFLGWRGGQPFRIEAEVGDAGDLAAVRGALDVLTALVDRGEAGRPPETLIELLERLLSDRDLLDEVYQVAAIHDTLGGEVSLTIDLIGPEPRAEIAFAAAIDTRKSQIEAPPVAIAGLGRAVFARGDINSVAPASRVRGQITLDDLCSVAALLRQGERYDQAG